MNYKGVINIALKNSQLDYNGFEFSDEEETAAWDQYYQRLLFNITTIKNASKSLKMNVSKKILSYYISLETIIHELTHARQQYIMERNKNYLYSTSYELIERDPYIYDDNHDLLLTERYANLRAQAIAYKVMSYIYPEEKISDLRLFLLDYLLYGYKYNIDIIQNPEDSSFIAIESDEITSAIDSHNNLLLQANMCPISVSVDGELSLYDRLYIGLPITKEEFNSLNELYINLNNTKGEVKQLVNKINTQK